MNDREQRMADSLVSIFEKVLVAEEKSLQKDYFKNLSLAEMHALDAIGPYESRTMTETAQILGVTVGTLTVAIDRLVKKGYVERCRDEKDRRVVRISLTRDGKLAARMHGKFHKVLAKHILEPYTDKEQDMLLGLVTDVEDYLNTQVSRYDDNSDTKQTAKKVAADVRRRKKMTDNDVPRERMEDKKDQIYEDLLNILTEELGVSPTDVNPTLDIRDDLAFDSLQLYSFIITVEEAYDIRITDEQIDKVHTMNDLVDMVCDIINQ